MTTSNYILDDHNDASAPYQGPYHASYFINNGTSRDTCHKLLEKHRHAKYCKVYHISMHRHLVQNQTIYRRTLYQQVGTYKSGVGGNRHRVHCRHLVR